MTFSPGSPICDYNGEEMWLLLLLKGIPCCSPGSPICDYNGEEMWLLLLLKGIPCCSPGSPICDYNGEEMWLLLLLKGKPCRFGLVCGLTSQSTAMAMSRPSLNLNTLFSLASLD